mgnify:CR=1 FL=1
MIIFIKINTRIVLKFQIPTWCCYSFRNDRAYTGKLTKKWNLESQLLREVIRLICTSIMCTYELKFITCRIINRLLDFYANIKGIKIYKIKYYNVREISMYTANIFSSFRWIIQILIFHAVIVRENSKFVSIVEFIRHCV